MPASPPQRDTRPLRRTVGESALVRRLGGWKSASADQVRPDAIDRLSQWLGVADAITLSSVLPSIRPPAEIGRAVLRPDLGQALDGEIARVRAALVAALQARIAPAVSLRPSRSRPAARTAAPAAPADFATYHQRYLGLQREMELRLGALRAYARQALARMSPRLAQLARLDATMDQVLAGRAHKELATIPAHLEARFKQLRKSASDESSDWQDGFEHEFRAVLLAELDVRMQPVLGLAEAAHEETKKTP